MRNITDKFTKTDVENLVLQGRGRIVNIDNAAYKDYITRQHALGVKDAEITELKNRLHLIEDKLNVVLNAFRLQEE